MATYEQMANLSYAQIDPALCDKCGHPDHGRYCAERVLGPETGLFEDCLCDEYAYLDEYDYTCHCFDEYEYPEDEE